MQSPLHALELDPPATEESRRHRPVAVASFPRHLVGDEEEHRESTELITLLADALERVAETTTDASAREIAEEALALFQDR